MKLQSGHLTEEGYKHFIQLILGIDRKMLSKKGLSGLDSSALMLETLIAFLVNNSGEFEKLALDHALQSRREYYPDWAKAHLIPVLLLQLSMFEVAIARSTTRTDQPFFDSRFVDDLHRGCSITGEGLLHRLGDSGFTRPSPKSRLIRGCVGVYSLIHLKDVFDRSSVPGAWAGKRVWALGDAMSHEASVDTREYKVPCLNCTASDGAACAIEWEPLSKTLDPKDVVLFWPGTFASEKA